MKKITAPLIILVLLLCSYTSNDGLLFKAGFAPQTKYIQHTNRSTDITILYSGSDAFLEKLKENGTSNPTVSKNGLKMLCIIKTGKLAEGGYFPITMEFDSVESSDGKQPLPDGTIMYGRATKVTMPELDSIFCPGKDEEFKQSLLKSMSSIFSQLSFPDKKLNVGDTFTKVYPLTIPIGGISMKMSITVTYKLTDIKNNIAYFDITETCTMSMDMDQSKGTGSGGGNGKLGYDIVHHYLSYDREDLTLNMNMKMDEFSMDLTLKQSSLQTTTFSSN